MTISVDAAVEYRAARERVDALVRSRSDDDLDRAVDACPGWRVRDVVAHLAGVGTDLVAGTMDGAPGEAWSARHVSAGAGRAVPDLLDTWAAASPAVEAMIAGAGDRMFFVVADIVSHEHDVRTALGVPGDAGAPIVGALTERFVAALAARVDGANLPALRVRTVGGDAGPWAAGTCTDGAVDVVVPSAFELLRAMTGRRSSDQIRAWRWSADPDPWLGVLSIFPIRATALVE